MTDDQVLTLDEACEILRVAPATIKDWRSKGEGPPFFKYIEGRTSPLFILRSALDGWIRDQAKANAS